MKTLKSTALALGLFGLLAGTTTLVRAQDYPNTYQDDGYNTGNVSLQTFYDELSPYGTWIQDPQYGYVWRPDVDQNEFRPYYTNGRWAMTEYGNTWVSNYDWGWAPFHYGRWVLNSYRQWIWLPDTNWGPAWVDWRSGDGYYGWAPMAPSININLSFGRRYSVPEFCWNFIPQASIYVNVFPRYNYARNNVYIRNTTIINNTYVYNRRSYYGGPRIEDIRRATNRDVTVYRFDRSSRPGASRVGGREVSIYRPRPERNPDNRNAAPRKFEQGNAGFDRNGRGNATANRDPRSGNNNNDNRFDPGNNNRQGQNNGKPDNSNRGGVNNATNNNDRGGMFNGNGRPERGSANADQNRVQQVQQQRDAQVDQQRQQRDQQQQQRSAQMDQQRIQRDAQMQQQRQQQVDQQRQQRDQQQQQQRDAQMQQQRVQRDAQMQQQRQQQADQQRQQRDQQQQQQRDAQMQQRQQQADQQRQQRDQQAQQQRQQQQQQRNEQMQQQRQQRMERPAENRTQAPPQQQNRGGGESGGRPSRGGRG